MDYISTSEFGRWAAVDLQWKEAAMEKLVEHGEKIAVFEHIQAQADRAKAAADRAKLAAWVGPPLAALITALVGLLHWR